MAVVALRHALISLMILYVLAFFFGFLASVPMLLHVTPKSECLLFSSQFGSKLSYGHYASCNFVGWVFLVVCVAAFYLFGRALLELRQFAKHHPQGPYVADKVPSHIIIVHICGSVLTLVLAIVLTAGYITACNNLHSGVSSSVLSKLNTNPYDTRGEEIQTRYEDDYKFHRYTNRYGNAFGQEFYTVRITCRSILTDPEIHQKLHDTHYEEQSRYYGYWYGTDLYAYDSQFEATKTNALVTTSLVGAWICFIFWLGGIVLIIVQRFFIRKQQIEQDRISMHSTMMGNNSMYQGDGSVIGSQFKNGSLISGKGSSFHRGGSRGSDRSRRDIDDNALNSILRTPQLARMNQPSSGYGRKDMDDLVLNQHIAQNKINQPPHSACGPNAQHQVYPQQYQQQPLLQQGAVSLHSSRETGYVSDGDNQFAVPRSSAYRFDQQAVPFRATDDAIYLRRDEMETEIF